MYDRYISFSDNSNSLNICDENFNVVKTVPLGESTISFLEIDYSQYATFYNDLHKVLTSNLVSTKRFEDIVIPKKLDKDIVDSFFVKYPKLKDYVYKKEEEFFEYMYKKSDEKKDQELFEIIDTTDDQRLKDIAYSLTKEGDINQSVEDKIYNRDEFKELSWEFIFNNECPNEYISNSDEIRYNPFVQLAYDDMSDESAIRYETAFHILKDVFWQPFIFCFDVEFNPLLNNLTALQRFYLFNKMYPGSRFSYEFTNSSFSVKSDLYIQFPQINELNEEVINMIQKQNVEQIQLYETLNINNMLYIEFNKMMQANIKVMKCKNCGKYFVLKGGYNTKYCDRIPEGEKYTCQKLAALKNQKEKLENNPIYKEYQKAYKRNYAKRTNGKMEKATFTSWVDEATVKRDETVELYNSNPNDQIILEFKEYLGNK